MKRPRWHDFIIVLSILALAGAGIGAIWGEEILDAIDGVLHSDEGPSEPKPAGAASRRHAVLLQRKKREDHPTG